MRLENMKDEFPRMPEDMRAMVEREVARQVHAAETLRRGTGKARKGVLVALVAVMVLGTTVFAGAIYRMRSSSNGEYGADIRIETNTADTETEGLSEQSTAGEVEILPVEMEVSYLPEGMVAADDGGKYCYEDAMYQGGVSICLYGMDTGDNQFAMSLEDVVLREDIAVNGYDGVYLKFSHLFEDEVTFDQRIYVAYPDIHYVLEMFVASDVTREEAIRIAEGITLTPTQEGEGAKCIRSYYWSEYLASISEVENVSADEATVSWESLEGTHAIGESFLLEEGLTVKVSEVQVLDNIRILDLSKDADLQKELARETDTEGNLLPCVANYIKSGNGTDTLSKIVNTKELPQKLVYATLEYTNTGEAELTDVLFWCSLMKLVETDGQVLLYSGEQPGSTEEWDIEQINGVAAFQEMYYYDIHGGERSNNYIPRIASGETITVHVAWLVPERDLKYMYLNLNGSPYEITQEDLAIGYVDIRK